MSCCDDKTPQGQQKAGLTGLLTGPRRWMLLGAVVVAGGLAMGWDQLVLLGIAPILVSLLPCLVMCGLGLCMMKCKDKKGKATDQGEATDVQAGVEPATEVSTETASAHRQAAVHEVSSEQSNSKFQA
ncbi:MULTISPECIES: hypothetical protein [Halomonadaceae]|uniref:DUF2933 domain-containing protein n=1 Tax=Modicisalibacter ilicicola DSM 19980 TaxID=1121942 RepID=A0A1M5CXP6_9GAMM|nr:MULTISPECIES: hypothetical protein [Halomonas]SHF59465.1 hypothetical protein SAMN02745148_03064 [Halomonas ilicicola DSM 19980]